MYVDSGVGYRQISAVLPGAVAYNLQGEELGWVEHVHHTAFPAFLLASGTTALVIPVQIMGKQVRL
jgi:hypothetical protein